MCCLGLLAPCACCAACAAREAANTATERAAIATERVIGAVQDRLPDRPPAGVRKMERDRDAYREKADEIRKKMKAGDQAARRPGGG